MSRRNEIGPTLPIPLPNIEKMSSGNQVRRMDRKDPPMHQFQCVSFQMGLAKKLEERPA